MLRARVLAPVLVLALSAAACGGGEKDDAPSASENATIAEVPAPDAGTAAPGETVFAGTLIKVDINGSKVAPRPSTHKIDKGDKVRIEVTSDQPDELHVHVYDHTADLRAGETAVIEFTADQSGRFEVETHDSGLLLFNLEVS